MLPFALSFVLIDHLEHLIEAIWPVFWTHVVVIPVALILSEVIIVASVEVRWVSAVLFRLREGAPVNFNVRHWPIRAWWVVVFFVLVVTIYGSHVNGLSSCEE